MVQIVKTVRMVQIVWFVWFVWFKSGNRPPLSVVRKENVKYFFYFWIPASAGITILNTGMT